MKEEFLKEFKALWKKYDSSITFSVDESSDTYGLYDEKMVIESRNETWLEVSGWGIDYTDIKE